VCVCVCVCVCSQVSIKACQVNKNGRQDTENEVKK